MGDEREAIEHFARIVEHNSWVCSGDDLGRLRTVLAMAERCEQAERRAEEAEERERDTKTRAEVAELERDRYLAEINDPDPRGLGWRVRALLAEDVERQQREKAETAIRERDEARRERDDLMDATDEWGRLVGRLRSRAEQAERDLSAARSALAETEKERDRLGEMASNSSDAFKAMRARAFDAEDALESGTGEEPADLTRLLWDCVRGMERWANDEDGVHPEAWEAYAAASEAAWTHCECATWARDSHQMLAGRHHPTCKRHPRNHRDDDGRPAHDYDAPTESGTGEEDEGRCPRCRSDSLTVRRTVSHEDGAFDMPCPHQWHRGPEAPGEHEERRHATNGTMQISDPQGAWWITVRDCLGCGCLVAGGPTRCKRCAADTAADPGDVRKWRDETRTMLRDTLPHDAVEDLLDAIDARVRLTEGREP